jgi:hypothetical protein
LQWGDNPLKIDVVIKEETSEEPLGLFVARLDGRLCADPRRSPHSLVFSLIVEARRGMANYLSYGFSAYEIEVNNHVIVRVFFAITVRDHPGWLSWYFFSQGSGAYALDFASALAGDSTRKIGNTIDRLAGQNFTFDKQINVNAFANTNKYGKISSSPATCTIRQFVGTDSKRKFLDCTVVIMNKLGAVNIHFLLSDEGGEHSFLSPNMAGHVDYVGTVDLSKQDVYSALAMGPVLSSPWLKDALRPDY